MISRNPREEIELRIKPSSDLSLEERSQLQSLFQRSYRQADPDFLHRSLEILGYTAMALSGGRVVGLALGETRRIDLPRLPRQLVSLAGLGCIDPQYRRHHLFLDLAQRALVSGEEGVAFSDEPRLVCGRMAHPAALRTMAQLPSVVPKPKTVPTPWQQEIGTAIAETYRVHDFDPTTFVCIGAGRPIGYPKIEIDAEPSEWELFTRVDRDRGDSLLAIAWYPHPPPDW
ncbi:MAG: hypothetical protein D6760_09335 [Deltaproteobacteria bacterium]|nr:MAG: hypothetical protein D6760_09335 [Deltaproteobacteria bacterium]